jgi:hypothetical protein
MDIDDQLEDLNEPDTLPNDIVEWQPTHRPLADARLGRAHVAEATGGAVLAAFAMGALAVGALAIGVLAIGRLNIGRAHIRRLEIDELVVRRIRPR